MFLNQLERPGSRSQVIDPRDSRGNASERGASPRDDREKSSRSNTRVLALEQAVERERRDNFRGALAEIRRDLQLEQVARQHIEQQLNETRGKTQTLTYSHTHTSNVYIFLNIEHFNLIYLYTTHHSTKTHTYTHTHTQT